MPCYPDSMPCHTMLSLILCFFPDLYFSLTFSHFYKDLQALMPNFLVSHYEEAQKPQWSQKLLYAILGLLVQVCPYCYCYYLFKSDLVRPFVFSRVHTTLQPSFVHRSIRQSQFNLTAPAQSV